jgi:group II intron reverse transcriptase/maturase
VRGELYDKMRNIGSAAPDLATREKYSLRNTSHNLGKMSETKARKHKWYSLYDKVYAPTNLERAWEKVRSNKGAGGVDRQSIADFEREKEQHLREMHRLLREKRYKPLSLRRVYIPKGNGERRPLGIPTIRDRVVQQALLNTLEPIFEPTFHEHSYGFRANRSTHTAIKHVVKSMQEGKEWVLEIDIRKYFDTVNHELLLDAVNEEVSDGSVLRLIRLFLESGVMENGVRQETEEGTPQGGVISPLLANIYLNRFDWEMAKRGHDMVRYADDAVVLCASREEAERALSDVRRMLEGKLRLKLHPEKTRILYHKEGSFDFLGFLVHRRYLWPRMKTLLRFKEKVRLATRRQQGRNVQDVIRLLNPVLRGFGNYYLRANVKGLFEKLDEWIRMRIRCFMEKKRAVKHQNRRIPNALLEEMGLISLAVLYTKSLLPPVMGQPYRKAVYGKSVCTV